MICPACGGWCVPRSSDQLARGIGITLRHVAPMEDPVRRAGIFAAALTMLEAELLGYCQACAFGVAAQKSVEARGEFYDGTPPRLQLVRGGGE